jgi:hypothetical protein
MQAYSLKINPENFCMFRFRESLNFIIMSLAYWYYSYLHFRYHPTYVIIVHPKVVMYLKTV